MRVLSDRTVRAGQRELAARLGISQATVCRALGGSTSVHPELRAAVLRAAEEVGYTPNLLARNLVRQSSSTIGVVASALNRPFFARAVHGGEEVAERRGYHTMVCSTDGRTDHEERVLRLLASHLVDGLVFVSASGRRDNTHITRFHRQYPRIVLVNRYGADPTIDTVLIDNEGGMRTATEHLVQAGHVRIGFVGLAGPNQGQNQIDRVSGYRAALASHGVCDAQEIALPFTADPLTVSTEALADLLRRHDRPTAIVTANDVLAVGVYRAAAEARLTIPRDLAVVAWEDYGYGRAMSPPLTVIVPPWQEAGRVATELLFQRLAQPEAPTSRVVLECALQVAGSSVAG